MAEHWDRRRWSSGGGQPRYTEYDYQHSHSEQPMYTNPPPPPYTQPPPPIYYSHPPPSHHQHHYPDPKGVSPPVGPVLDHSDYSSSRPGSSLSQGNTHTNSYSPSIATTSGNSNSKCSFCFLVFSTPSLPTHLSSCHSSLLFHCIVLSTPGSVCGQQFLSVPQLRSHLFSQHLVTTFSCDKLTRVGAIILPSDLRLYRCKKCPADQGTFYGSSPHLMAVHLASHHPEVTGPASSSQLVGYECRACDKYQLEDESHLLKHIQLRHSRTREPSVELIAGPVIQPSPSPVYIAPDSPDMTSDLTGQKSAPAGAEADTSLNSAELTRCNMCPSPGLVHKDQVRTHQRAHNTALFTCAPCKLKFELYNDVESHIKVKHKVSLASSILESIILPAREQLVTLQCGVCSRQFVGQGEQVLVSHIETNHGKYYVGVGGGKNMLRLCRVCGELCRDGGEMLRHLDTEHNGKMFAGDSDNENTDNGDAESIIVTTKTTSNKVAFMDIFKEEVARRKVEFEKQELEKKKLRQILCSDSSSSNISDDDIESDSDVEEVKEIIKRKTSENQRKKSRKHYSSDSEGHSSGKFEVKRKRKRKCDSNDDDKRKWLKKNGRVRKEKPDKEQKAAEHKGSNNCIIQEERENSPRCSDDSVQYKYQRCSNRSSNKDELSRNKLYNSKESKSVKGKDKDNFDLQLKQSSTEKLLEAKELVRVTIQKEENRQKKASVLTSGAKRFEEDLKQMKQQLTETLRKSRELTKKMQKKHSEKSSKRESEHEATISPIESQDEGIDMAPVKLKLSELNSPKLTENRNSQEAKQAVSSPQQKLSKFKMTWKKK